MMTHPLTSPGKVVTLIPTPLSDSSPFPNSVGSWENIWVVIRLWGGWWAKVLYSEDLV